MYLFSPIVIEQSRAIADSVFGLHHNLLLAPLNLLITIGICWISYLLFEQPTIKWGHRLAKRIAEAARLKGKISLKTPTTE
jgi:peptidoglycan/LPS O-acetylase OafA/YrhL